MEDISEREEGEWSGEETETQESFSRLFHVEHFQRLLNKVITTLNYQIEVTEKPRSTMTAQLDTRGFKKPARV